MPPIHQFDTNGFDSIVAATTTIIAATSAAILAVVPDPTDELKLLMVPLVGALLVAAGTILLYPEKETRSVVVGRATIALVFSSLMPQVCAILFPSTAGLLEHPVVLLFLGSILFMPFYVLIRPLFEGMYRRRKVIAEALLEQGQERLMGTVRGAVNEAVDNKIQEAVNDPASRRAAKVVISTAVEAAQVLKNTAEEVKKAASEGIKTDRLQ